MKKKMEDAFNRKLDDEDRDRAEFYKWLNEKQKEYQKKHLKILNESNKKFMERL